MVELRGWLSSTSLEDEEKDLLDHEGPTSKAKRPGSHFMSRSILVLIGVIALAFFSVAIFFQSFRLLDFFVSSPTACSSLSIRREWRSFSTAEKRAYTNAVHCLNTRPSVLGLNQSLYDDFSYIHVRVGDPTHDTPNFLPWHRYFVHIYESKLKEECSYAGHMPYWDWMLDWEDLRRSPIWDAEDGFGGDGDISLPPSIGRGRCVTNGPFASLELQNANMSVHPHCLSRGFADDAEIRRWSREIAPENVGRILSLARYHEFFDELENGPHLAIPFSIRGEFFYFTSPNEPVFFLHHTQLDRLWFEWQSVFHDHKQTEWNGWEWENGMSTVLDMGRLAPGIRVNEVMRTQGSLLCYSYV